MAKPACAWWTKLDGRDGLGEKSYGLGPAPMGTLPSRPMIPCSAMSENELERAYFALSVSPTPNGDPMIAALYWPAPYWPSVPYELRNAPTVQLSPSFCDTGTVNTRNASFKKFWLLVSCHVCPLVGFHVLSLTTAFTV